MPESGNSKKLKGGIYVVYDFICTILIYLVSPCDCDTFDGFSNSVEGVMTHELN